ncbi:MAG: heme biosynthesis protein HemY [Rhodobacter sp.]|nr:heme biosynthesis protein HemY [Rhodobacter sp.]
MIWSLIKVLVFIALVAALTLGASFLLETGGGIRVAVAGYEFTLGPLQAVILALVLLGVIWLVLKVIGLVVAVLRFLNGDETAISRYFDRNRERKGYQAFAEGMIALASGEPRTAMSRAIRAEKLLAQPELTTILTAQAAQAAGDTRKAIEAYKTLLSDPRSRFIGIRGLIQQKLAEGDRETALKLAEKAFALKPKHKETQDLLLELQAESSDWTGARATLGAKLRAGHIPKDIHRRRDAVLALQEARAIIDDGSNIEAREAAIAAHRLSPDLVPAAAMAARSYIAKGDSRNATRLLKKAWENAPHPDLAAAFADIVPDETPSERVKRFRTLTSVRPEDEETRLLLAELNLAAEDFPAARRALGDLPTRHPTRRSLAIMAAVERGEGADEAVVRGWLARTLTAPRGPQWVCDKCQNIHSEWTPVCSNCGGFDTLSWREPSEGAGPSATQTELLPLLVGSPAPTATEDAEPADRPA